MKGPARTPSVRCGASTATGRRQRLFRRRDFPELNAEHADTHTDADTRAGRHTGTHADMHANSHADRYTD